LWLWLAFFSFVFALPAGCTWLLGFPATWSDDLKWSGTVFQLAGIVTVIRDLNGAASELGASSMGATITDFGKDVVGIFRGRRTVSASITLSAATLVATGGRATIHFESHGTVEQRLANLETRMLRQEKDVTRIETSIDSHVRELSKKIEAERDQRKVDEAKMVERLRNAVVGKMHVKLGGIAYLVLGTVLTSVPL